MKIRLIIIALLTAIGASLYVAANREKKRWGMKGRHSSEGVTASIDTSAQAEKDREVCKRDLKYLYQHVLAPEVTIGATGRTHAEQWGKIHDIFADFLCFELENVEGHSELFTHLPPKADGKFKERWLYWPTLDAIPNVQDGPDGPLSEMFYKSEKIWRGVLVRVCGDGCHKCALLPRGHLKSTLGSQAYSMWRIIREPWLRLLIASHKYNLATGFVSAQKTHFEHNQRFRSLFGDLGPPAKREGCWKTDMFQVHSPYGWRSLGVEPTLSSVRLGSDIVGNHYDVMVLDDVVGKKNTETIGQVEKTVGFVQSYHGVLDPHSTFLDIGTPWHEQDAHHLFTGRDSDMASDCSFIVATVSDDLGEPIWPQIFTKEVIAKKRRGLPADRDFYGQYYCQFTGTSVRTFSTSWITPYVGQPSDLLSQFPLDIYMAVDTASGERETKTGDLDYTAAIVLGQSHDRTRIYLLDGFNEKLGPDAIAKSIVALALKWIGLAKPGATFRVGVEETAYTNFLETSLRYVQRMLGVQSKFSIEPLKHNNISKKERIRVLATPFSEHCILWPEKLIVVPASTLVANLNTKLKIDVQDAPETAPYDLMEMLTPQYRVFPMTGAHDDLLDAFAYAYQLCRPRDWNNPAPPAREPAALDSYERGNTQGQKLGLGGFKKGGRIALG